MLTHMGICSGCCGAAVVGRALFRRAFKLYWAIPFKDPHTEIKGAYYQISNAGPL
jgi:hypothetical protein